MLLHFILSRLQLSFHLWCLSLSLSTTIEAAHIGGRLHPKIARSHEVHLLKILLINTLKVRSVKVIYY